MKNVIAALIVGTIITATLGVYANTTQKDIASALIRLHVRANSNSKEDQQAKLKVRDRIIKEISPLLENAANINESYSIINQNLENIEYIAHDELNKDNFNYGVKASLGLEYFPTKSYDGLMLPPGEYDSLIIELGEANGENWWCVMFPPLCFVDSAKGEISNSSKDKLKENMDSDSYEIVSQSNKLPVQIKFKILEVFGNAKWRLYAKK